MREFAGKAWQRAAACAGARRALAAPRREEGGVLLRLDESPLDALVEAVEAFHQLVSKRVLLAFEGVQH
jgi:hypothetical protein